MIRLACAAAMLAPLLAAQAPPAIGPRPVPGGPPRAGDFGGRRPGGQQQQQARKEYRPEELCTVEGYVRNGVTGEALSKASIILSPAARAQQQPQQGYAASSDGSGKFSIRGVEPGQYRISVRRNGFVSSDQQNRRGISPSGTLTLSTGQSLKNVEAKLIPHGVVTGRITDSEGEPIVYANVQLMRYRYNPQGQRDLAPSNTVQTNDLGEFRLFGVPPGKYFLGVTVRTPRGAGNTDTPSDDPIPTFFPGATDVAQATQIDVPMGGTVQGIDVRMMKARTFTVSGQITGAASSRRGGVVRLTARGSGNVPEMMRAGLNAPWRPDGKFTVRGVPPGSYTLIADAFDGQGRMHGTTDVEVGSRDVDNAQVAMQASFELEGVVRIEGQETPELSNIIVALQSREQGGRFGGAGAGRTGADGRAALRQVFPGHFDVTVNGLPENHYVKAVRAGEVEGLENGLRVMPGMQLDVVVSPKGGQISGGVVNEKGDPVGSGSVILLAPDAPPMRRLKIVGVDQQGQYRLSGIAPGAYFLVAVEEAESGVFWEPEFLLRNDKMVEKISIREGATESKTLKLIPGSGE